jgi:hypothetical protein
LSCADSLRGESDSTSLAAWAISFGVILILIAVRWCLV